MKEREKKGPTFGIEPQGGQSSRSPNALSHEQLGCCAELLKQTCELLATQHGTCTRTYKKSGLMFKHVNNKIRGPNRTIQEKVVASRSDCEHADREFIVDSGASLNIMSKNELTSGEKDNLIRSKELTVITIASGKTESMEEATAKRQLSGRFCHPVASLRTMCQLWQFPKERMPDVPEKASGDRFAFSRYPGTGKPDVYSRMA